MKGILGRKIGMTEKFTTDGKVIPVTVISVEPNVITQIKTVDTDGYNAIQLGMTDKKEKHATKQEIGHAKKAGVAPKRFLKMCGGVYRVKAFFRRGTVAPFAFDLDNKFVRRGIAKSVGVCKMSCRNG